MEIAGWGPTSLLQEVQEDRGEAEAGEDILQNNLHAEYHFLIQHVA